MELNLQVLRLSIMLAYFDTEQMFWESSEDHKECAQILGGASSDLLSPRLLGINCQLVSAASAGGAQSKPAWVAKFIQFYFFILKKIPSEMEVAPRYNC